jgi:hypothetical protein
MLILMFRRLSPRSRAITGLVLMVSSWLSRRRQLVFAKAIRRRAGAGMARRAAAGFRTGTPRR